MENRKGIVRRRRAALLVKQLVTVTEAGEKFTVMQKRPVDRHEEAAKSAARIIASSGRRTLPRPVWDAACDDLDHLFRHELVSGLVDVNSIEKVGIYRLIEQIASIMDRQAGSQSGPIDQLDQLAISGINLLERLRNPKFLGREVHCASKA